MQDMTQATGLLPATPPQPAQAQPRQALLFPPLDGLAYLESSASG